MITVYVDLDDTDSGRDISIRYTDVRNELVIDMTFYTDPVLNVEFFLRSNDYFGYINIVFFYLEAPVISGN
jgi:hypothetical protein